MELDFRVSHLENNDIEQYLEVSRFVFGLDSGVDLLLRKLILKHPGMSLQNHFVIKQGDRIVSTLNLIPATWSIGGVNLKVAEMGCVGTLEAFRRRGLVRRLIDEYHRKIKEEEFDLSVIEGIPYFYRQFGYEYAIPLDEETTIPIQKLPECNGSLNFRPFRADDVPEAMRLLDMTQREYYLHSVRNEAIWTLQEKTKIANEYPFESHVIEHKGKMIGYLRFSMKTDERVIVLREFVDPGNRAGTEVLAFLKRRSKNNGVEILVSRISNQEVLTKRLVSLGAGQNRPYAWQIRISDVVELMRKMIHLFDARLADSECATLSENLGINFRRFIVELCIENGKVTLIKRSQESGKRVMSVNPDVFGKLLFGYKSIGELMDCYLDFAVVPDHRSILDLLFPKLPSFIHAYY